MKAPITRECLYNICDTFEQYYIEKYVNSAVEYIKQQIIERAYADCPHRSPRFLQRIQNKSYASHVLRINLPLSIPHINMSNYYLTIETMNELVSNIGVELKKIFPDTLFSIDRENNQFVIDWT